MATYKYTAGGEGGVVGCPGTVLEKGWYEVGNPTLLTSSYRNPTTGMAYTPNELASMGGGTPTGVTPTTRPTTPVGTTPTTSQLEATTTPQTKPVYNDYASFAAVYSKAPYTQIFKTSNALVDAWSKYQETGLLPSVSATTPATTTPTTSTVQPTTSQLEGMTSPTGQKSNHTGATTTNPLANLQVPNVPTLPAYQPSAELEALSNKVGGAISDIIEQGGIGMGEDTKEALFLREAEVINANTAMASKNLEDKMAAQGLSNSGMAFSENMKLASKGTIAMANVMRDVQIQDSLMKVASYQNALGLGVQFLSYLSEESWREYQPTILNWQAKVDMYKTAITQAYTQSNMALAQKYSMQLAQFEAQTNIQLTQMSIDAAAKAASKQNFWDILGTALGVFAGIFL